MKVKARFEYIIAFSFLLEGSRFIASVYFCSASSYLPLLICSFPSSLSCSHFLVVFKANLHFFWSGSSLMPSVKYFFALELSPPYSSIIPFKYQKSGDCWSFPTKMVFNSVSASVVSPVLAKASTLNSFNFQFCGILSARQLIQESASVQSDFSTACWYLSKFELKLSASSSSFLMTMSFSQSNAFLKDVIASENLRIWIDAIPFLLSAFVKFGLMARQLSQSAMHFKYSPALEQAAALFEQQL